MFSSARSVLIIGIVITALSLAACEAADATPTPRPTWTPRVVTIVVTATPEPSNISVPTSTPISVALAYPTAASAPRVAAPAPVVNDPLLPKFAPFPPIPIPARPANINPLTGLKVDPAVLGRRPIVARIGNDQIVRTSNWHAGLSQADVVFEELIDILGSQYANTRYSAVYLTNDPPAIGPIRSGRIINFQIVPMLDAAFAHAGASNGTRWLFSQSPMVNLDEYFNQPAFCYNTQHGYQGRLYTSAVRIREWLKQKGWEAPVPLYGFSFSNSAPNGQPVTNIGFNKSPWPTWDSVQWKYDVGSGSYLRFTLNSPHMDSLYSLTAKWGNGADCILSSKETQTQIRASNVVILYAPHEKTNIIEDSNNAVTVHITLTGKGNAQFFRDGVSLLGKWQRGSEQEFFKFTDAAGNAVSLKPGITWFEIVPIGYQPDLK